MFRAGAVILQQIAAGTLPQPAFLVSRPFLLVSAPPLACLYRPSCISPMSGDVSMLSDDDRPLSLKTPATRGAQNGHVSVNGNGHALSDSSTSEDDDMPLVRPCLSSQVVAEGPKLSGLSLKPPAPSPSQ